MRSLDVLRIVSPDRRRAPVAALATWCGAVVGLVAGVWPVGLALVVAGLWLAGRHVGIAVLLALCGAGMVAGAVAGDRMARSAAAPVVEGDTRVFGLAITDPVERDGVHEFLLRVESATGRGSLTRGTVAIVETETVGEFLAGDRVHLTGAVRDAPGRLGADEYRAAVRSADIGSVEHTRSPWIASGNALRRHVLDRLDPVIDRPEGGLLAGFLVGDTTHIPADDLDDLRTAGLTHFVAVSGSNVALFLVAWWFVVAPLGLDPRWRAATALAALGVFVVATRWEPSVVRAAAMAAVVLGGRIVGTKVDPWQALGVAVTGLLLVSADLAVDVGFQLSVLATAGVLGAMRVRIARRPVWLWRILAATLGAQLAVLPVLLLTFGTVPLLSPVANVLAAPLVTAATALGGIGALVGVAAIRDLGLAAGRLVLDVAHVAAGWPQLDLPGSAAALLAGAAMFRRPTRGVAVAGVAAWLVVWLLPVSIQPGPKVVFMDVGQGDAILVVDRTGHSVLIDGGREPDVLASALDRNGVGSLDLVVVTHGDADHAGGLVGLAGRIPIRALWHGADQQAGDIVDEVITEASSRGIPVTAVRTGVTSALDGVALQILGPGRRYAADNDGSIVTWVASAAGGTVLLTGDVEAVGQSELPDLRPLVLQVPHHGSSTTDLAWLRRTVGPLAIISVGENTFGHPTPEILDTLEDAGAKVYTTRRDGDLTVPLG